MQLDEAFDVKALDAGELELGPQLRVEISDLAGNPLQTVEFHTSCSQPLAVGDQFGSLLLEAFTAAP